MTKKTFDRLVKTLSFGEAVEMLRLEYQNEITTYEDLVNYCIQELQMDGDFAAVKNILETLDESYGYWVYDYSIGNIPPKPILSADDVCGFFDEEDDTETYFLLNQIGGRPWEIIKVKGTVKRENIQRVIYKLLSYYTDHEDLVDDCACAYDYMISRLGEQYDLEVLPWNNDDILYY